MQDNLALIELLRVYADKSKFINFSFVTEFINASSRVAIILGKHAKTALEIELRNNNSLHRTAKIIWD